MSEFQCRLCGACDTNEVSVEHDATPLDHEECEDA